MINQSILTNRVYNKYAKTCLTAIVTETFMKALPFTPKDVCNDTHKYTAYTNAIMESLHCESMLQTAMEAHNDNPSAMNLLNTIYHAVDSVATDATNRIVTEAVSQKCDNIDEVLDKTAFTNEDKKKLMSKSKDINTNTISEIIKKKVIDTIKDEKDAYDASMKLKDDIKSNLQDALGDDSPSLEAYFDTVLQKSDPRDHISFFSRLQDTCMESLIHMETPESLEYSEDVSLECLINTTINSTFDSFDRTALSLETSFDIINKAIEAVEFSPCDTDKTIYGQKSLIMSIIITTIMETLKTLNLWSPSLTEMKTFVDAPTRLNTPVKNLEEKIHEEMVSTKKNVAHNALDKDGLSIALGAFNQIKAKVSAISEEMLPNKNTLMSELSDSIALLEGAIAKDTDGSNNEDNGLSYYTNHYRESNVATFDRVARVMFRNPNIKKAQIVVDSSTPMNTVNKIIINGMDSNGNTVDQITACIYMVPAFKSLIDEIKTACCFSNMSKYSDQCEIYLSNKCCALKIYD